MTDFFDVIVIDKLSHKVVGIDAGQLNCAGWKIKNIDFDVT